MTKMVQQWLLLVLPLCSCCFGCCGTAIAEKMKKQQIDLSETKAVTRFRIIFWLGDKPSGESFGLSPNNLFSHHVVWISEYSTKYDCLRQHIWVVNLNTFQYWSRSRMKMIAAANNANADIKWRNEGDQLSPIFIYCNSSECMDGAAVSDQIVLYRMIKLVYSSSSTSSNLTNAARIVHVMLNIRLREWWIFEYAMAWAQRECEALGLFVHELKAKCAVSTHLIIKINSNRKPKLLYNQGPILAQTKSAWPNESHYSVHTNWYNSVFSKR